VSYANISKGEHLAEHAVGDEGNRENVQCEREERLRTASGISFRVWRRLMS